MTISKPVVLKALVTGATGFIGNCLVRNLLGNGWQVTALVRSSLKPDAIPLNNCHYSHYDGTTQSIEAALKQSQPDVVFHLASLFISEHRTVDIEPLIQSNILLGSQLLECMQTNNVKRMINTGTSWQSYENILGRPVNLYAATKNAFETICRYYTEAHGFQIATLALFDTYGPNDPRKKLIPLALDACRTGTALSLSPGEQLIDLVHVEDVVAAYLTAATLLLEPRIKLQERFAVSSGAPLSLRDLFNKCERAWGRSIPVRWGSREYRNREVMTPPTVDARLPNWTPSIQLEEGLKRIFDWETMAK